MKCKNCNKKEAVKYGKYTLGEFCSRSCSNIRTHSDQTKKKISETIKRLRPKKEITNCISCFDVLTAHSESKYCLACRPFVYNRKLFGKLGIRETNLKIASSIALDILKKLYFEQKKSLLDIYREYGIKENTVFWFFKKNGIPCRSLSKSIKNSYTQGKGCPVNPYDGSIYARGWHTTWFGKEVFLRSSYEKKFAEHLDKKRVYYEVEGKRIRYIFEGEEHTYITDFFIPDWNMIVETKNGYFYNEHRLIIDAKIKAAEDEGYKIVLLVDGEVDKYIMKNA